MDFEMTSVEKSLSNSLIPVDKIAEIFGKIRKNLQQKQNPKNPDASIIGWSTLTLEEINPNIKRSLLSKYRACTNKGFKAAKIAGLYAFWIAKLKPIFSPFTAFRGLNEYAALNIGIAYINERINVPITLDCDEVFDLCEMLRYHTSSPHAMAQLFTLLIEREKLRQQVSGLEEKLKPILP